MSFFAVKCRWICPSHRWLDARFLFLLSGRRARGPSCSPRLLARSSPPLHTAFFFCGPLFLPHANRPNKHSIGRAAPDRRGGEAQGRRLHLRRRSPVLPHPVPGVRSGSGRFRCCAVLCRRAPVSADGGLVSVLSTAAPRLHAAVRSSVSRHAACPRALFCLHRARQNKSLWAFFLFCHVEG